MALSAYLDAAVVEGVRQALLAELAQDLSDDERLIILQAMGLLDDGVSF